MVEFTRCHLCEMAIACAASKTCAWGRGLFGAPVVKHPQPPDPASDCATHNWSAMIEPVDTSKLRSLAAGNVGPLSGAIMERAAAEIDHLRSTLRTARALIAGIADTMDDAERAAIAEYDVALVQIDEVLK